MSERLGNYQVDEIAIDRTWGVRALGATEYISKHATIEAARAAAARYDTGDIRRGKVAVDHYAKGQYWLDRYNKLAGNS